MFSINGSQLVAAASFNFEDQISYSVRIRVTNQAGRFSESAFVVSVLNSNDAPQLNPFGVQVAPQINEDTLTDLGVAIVDLVKTSLSDDDVGAVKGIALTDLTGTATGQWQYTLDAGANWTRILSASIALARLLPSDGANSRLRYIPNRNFNGKVTFTFCGWDQTTGIVGGTANLFPIGSAGGSTAFSLARKTTTITIVPVNDAPVMNTSGSPKLPTITEDSVPGPGASVATLIGTSITDVDANSKRGIAIVRVTGGSLGSWQYTLDNGASWLNLGSVSTSSALLLPNTGVGARVRFVPIANANGNFTLMYLAWDQTSGTIAGRADLSSISSRGGTTAFSKELETASISVIPINDAPLLDTSRSILLGQFASATPLPPSYSAAKLVSPFSRDVDAGALQGIAITSLPTLNSGVWRYSLDSGTTWTVIAATTSSNALLLPSTALLQFVPSRTGSQLPSFRYLAWDQTSGQVGSRVNLSAITSRGGTKAFSVAEGVARVEVTL